jgi:hypothetical protein
LIVIEVETSPSGDAREERLRVVERVDRDALAPTSPSERAWSES